MTKTLKNDLSAELGNKTPKPQILLFQGIYFGRCTRLEGQREGRDWTISHILFSKHDTSRSLLIKQMVEISNWLSCTPKRLMNT